MKAILLVAVLVVSVISVYIQITANAKRNKTLNLAQWKKYNLHMTIAGVVSNISGVALGVTGANIVSYGW